MSLLAVAFGAVSAATAGNAKDAERKARNAAAYSLALQGDQAALTFLGCMAGILPRQNVPGYGDCGGWATDAAKKDAASLYNQAVAASKGLSISPTSPEPSLLDRVQTIAQGFANEIGTAAGQAATAGQAGQAVQSVANTTKTALTLLVIAAIGAAAFYAYKHR